MAQKATGKTLTKKPVNKQENPDVENMDEVETTVEDTTETTESATMEETETVETKEAPESDNNDEKETTEKVGFTNTNLCKVKLAKDYTCSIGGTRYFFKKDVVTDVPPNVKRILKQGDLLRP